MLILLGLLSLTDEWPLSTERAQCSHASLVSPAWQRAYFPDEYLAGEACLYASGLLHDFDHEPLTPPVARWDFRAVATRSFQRPISFEVWHRRENENPFLVWQELGDPREPNLTSFPRYGEYELSPEDQIRLQALANDAVCLVRYEERFGLDGSTWTFEFADTARYCAHHEWGPVHPLTRDLIEFLTRLADTGGD